ncbi:MAG: LEA type 2 family protein [Gemmatimonadota bacterium]
MTAYSRLRGAALLPLLVLATIAACTPDFVEPRISIEGVRVGRVGFDGGVVHVLVRVDNPNDFDIEASRVDYDLDLGRGEDWVDLAEGELEDGLTVPALGSADVEIPVEFGLGDALSLASTVFAGEAPRYRVSGSVDLQRPIRRRVPYRQEGFADLNGSARR